MKDRIFAIVGKDYHERKNKLIHLKTNILQQIASSSLNEVTLFSHEVDVTSLQDTLFSYSFEGMRIVIFKKARELSNEVQKFLRASLQDIVTLNFLIFEIEEDAVFLQRSASRSRNSFITFLLANAKVFALPSSYDPEVSIWEIINNIRRKRLDNALAALEEVFVQAGKNKELLGMQILGAITKVLSQDSSLPERREKFHLLWKAERSLKLGHDPRVLLELLLIKMFTV